MFIYFPNMHPAFVPSPLPKGVRLLDPGLDVSGEACFAPDTLPWNAGQSRAFLRDGAGFGETFKKPSDLAYFRAGRMEDFYTGTRMDISSELRAMEKVSPESEAALPVEAAQKYLLLAWQLEERLIELKDLDDSLEEGWGKFRRSLGLDDDAEDDADLAGLGEGALSPDPAKAANELAPVWAKVLEMMHVVSPGDAGFFSALPEVEADMTEAGLSLSSRPGADYGLLHGECLVVSAPVWRLVGRTRPDAGRPWLDRERTVVLAKT